MLAASLLTASAAFSPPLVSMRPSEASRATRCGSGPFCTAAGTRRAALLAGAAAAASLRPDAASAGNEYSYYMNEDDEKTQTYILAAIGSIILVSPIVGIQMARGAISAMVEQDDSLAAEFRGNNDPEWSVTPSARKNKAKRELQARLAAEEKKSGWFSFGGDNAKKKAKTLELQERLKAEKKAKSWF